MQEGPRIFIVPHQLLHVLETVIHKDGHYFNLALQALLKDFQVFIFLDTVIAEGIAKTQVYVFPLEVGEVDQRAVMVIQCKIRWRIT